MRGIANRTSIAWRTPSPRSISRSPGELPVLQAARIHPGRSHLPRHARSTLEAGLSPVCNRCRRTALFLVVELRTRGVRRCTYRIEAKRTKQGGRVKATGPVWRFSHYNSSNPGVGGVSPNSQLAAPANSARFIYFKIWHLPCLVRSLWRPTYNSTTSTPLDLAFSCASGFSNSSSRWSSLPNPFSQMC